MVSATEIDRKLYELRTFCEQKRASGNKLYYMFEWVYFTINRYIGTGRASVDWLEKFLAADAEDLMNKVYLYSGTYDDCMKKINHYLHIKDRRN